MSCESPIMIGKADFSAFTDPASGPGSGGCVAYLLPGEESLSAWQERGQAGESLEQQSWDPADMDGAAPGSSLVSDEKAHPH